MKNPILNYLSTECPWRDTLYWYDTIDSTNTKAKELARCGAAHGTVVAAQHQSAGRGRLGRSFCSDAGMGVYLSVILRPACKPEQLMHLTCAAAVAACNAVEAVTTLRPNIKWINDLIIGTKKLGGILTELSVEPATGLTDYAIIGIGINCGQEPKDFPAELIPMATSLKMATGKKIPPAQLAGELICQLYAMDQQLLTEKAAIMQTYKANCITLGQDVMLNCADTVHYAKAIDLDESGALLVQFPDGSTKWVQSGEASIRGMYGYV